MKIILASKSGVRKQILDKYNIDNEVIISNVDEDEVKQSLLAEGANPLSISKNLAELKSIKVSNQQPDRLVLGADSVISLNEELINKPGSREEAFKILKKLTAAKVGIDNKKDIFTASSLLNFNILAAEIVIPDLLTPGSKDRT